MAGRGRMRCGDAPHLGCREVVVDDRSIGRTSIDAHLRNRERELHAALLLGLLGGLALVLVLALDIDAPLLRFCRDENFAFEFRTLLVAVAAG